VILAHLIFQVKTKLVITALPIMESTFQQQHSNMAKVFKEKLTQFKNKTIILGKEPLISYSICRITIFISGEKPHRTVRIHLIILHLPTEKTMRKAPKTVEETINQGTML